MSWFEDSNKIKDEILSFGAQHKKEETRNIPLEQLLTHLKEKTGQEITEDKIKTACLDPDFIGELSLNYLINLITFEKNSIANLERIFGKPITEMNPQEMEENAYKLACMTLEEYAGYNHPLTTQEVNISWGMHPDILFYALEKMHGIKTDVSEMADKITKMDLGLGFFHNVFCGNLRYFSGLEMEHKRDIDYAKIIRTLRCERDNQKENLKNHTTFDAELVRKHKIPQPELLEDMTVSLDISPLGIEFDSDGHLIILAHKQEGEQREIAEEDFYSNRKDRNLQLLMCDIKKREIVKQAATDLIGLFDGTPLGANEFSGCLSIGSNRIIYVGGSRNTIQRFKKDLTSLDQNCSLRSSYRTEKNNEDGYIDAINVLQDKKILSGRSSDIDIFQATEDKGIFYFALRPDNFPYCYNNFLVATDGKKMIHNPIRYDTVDGGHSSAWNTNPRIMISDDKVYVKAHHRIMEFDKNLENQFMMVDAEENQSGCIPASQCVDAKGRLWVVTQLKDEVIPTIKAYVRGKEKGEIITHIVPENYPGGWPAFRSMAIDRKNNILAYTEAHANKIHFYQIKD